MPFCAIDPAPPAAEDDEDEDDEDDEEEEDEEGDDAPASVLPFEALLSFFSLIRLISYSNLAKGRIV